MICILKGLEAIKVIRITQVLQVFGSGEARALSCDLEEDSAWLSEVDRAEVVAVCHRRHRKPSAVQVLTPRAVLLLVRSTERHVMYSSRADCATQWEIRACHKSHLRSRSARSNLESGRLMPILGVLIDLIEAQNLCEYQPQSFRL